MMDVTPTRNSEAYRRFAVDPFLFQEEEAPLPPVLARSAPLPIIRVTVDYVKAAILLCALYPLVFSFLVLLSLTPLNHVTRVRNKFEKSNGQLGAPSTGGLDTTSITSIKSFIPDYIDRRTFGKLAVELSSDWEDSRQCAGFIYVLWSSPGDEPPSRELARLLTKRYDRRQVYQEMLRANYSSSQRRLLERNSRRRSRSSSTSSSARLSMPEDGEMYVKVGFASDVKSVKEWASQCKRDTSLMLFYHNATGNKGRSIIFEKLDSFESMTQDISIETGAANVFSGLRPGADGKDWEDLSSSSQIIPFARYVQKLVHDELEQYRLSKGCDCKPKEYRDWFRISASQAGIEMIDECISRWINWARLECREQDAFRRRLSLSMGFHMDKAGMIPTQAVLPKDVRAVG